ncbi:MAG TPA: hypothetical protein VGG27_09450 [Magnetospirillaceae bacterium]|jgi:hypothetical protein
MSRRASKFSKRRDELLPVLDNDVLRFLRGAIGSFWALEQLLVLHRDSMRGWTVDTMAHELRGSSTICNGVFVRFAKAGLVEEANGEFFYHPHTKELAEIVNRLATSYATYPVAVARAIQTALDQELQSFANAFRLDKKE